MKVKLGKLEIEVKEFPFGLYDKDGNVSYYCNSNGYQCWKEYDKGNITYFCNSNGEEWGTPRSKSCEGKMVEIDGKKYELKEVK